jgi:hypothetical protein
VLRELLFNPLFPEASRACAAVFPGQIRHPGRNTMKSKIPSAHAGALQNETPTERATRRRKLKRLLNTGLGLKAGALRQAVRPGYLETFRAMEDPAPYGRRRSRR